MTSKKSPPPDPEHRRVYWDSCIFIAWLTQESRSQIELDGLDECVRAAKEKRAIVVVSRIFEIEVLVEAMPLTAKSLLQRFLRQRNVEVVDQEAPISGLARAIRTHYVLRKREGLKGFVPSTPDSIHLATAINRQVDAFYTFDKGGKDRGNLLSLDGDVAGHALKICIPPAKQLTLRFRSPDSPPQTGAQRPPKRPKR